MIGDANVRDYGAKGDGISDDTYAVQSAVTAGTTVCFPPGTYLVGRINIPSNRTLVGYGWSSVITLKDGANTPLMINDTYTGSGNTDIHIRNLKIDGNYAGNSSTSAGNRCNCITLINAQRSSVRDCWLVNAAMDGIYIGASGITAPVGVGSVGGPCQDIMITGNRIELSTRNGISVTRGRDISIIGNEFYSNSMGCVAPISNPGVYGAATIDIEPNSPSDAAERILVSGNRLRDCKFTGIALSGSPIHKDIQITSNSIHMAEPRPAITCSTTVTGCVISGNAITGNATQGVVWGSISDGGGANTGVISGNVLRTDLSSGMTSGVSVQHGAKKVAVTGNSISGFQYGVATNGYLYPVSDVLVVGNHIATRSGANWIAPRATAGLVDVGNLKGSGEGNYTANNDAPGSHPSRLSIGQPAGASAITKHCTGAKAWSTGTVADGAVASTTLTVTGARPGNTAAVGFSAVLPAGVMLFPAVTADDQATVTLHNRSGATVDLSGTLRVDTWAH